MALPVASSCLPHQAHICEPSGMCGTGQLGAHLRLNFPIFMGCSLAPASECFIGAT